jgi:hypothetical protein
MPLSFGDKALLTFVCSLTIAIFFSVYQIYFFYLFPATKSIQVVFELLFLSLPLYFFLLNVEDGSLGILSGLTYFFVKAFIISVLKVEPICIFDGIIFTFSFTILALAISFQREQSLKNVRFSLLGTVTIFLAFSIAILTLLVYYNTYPKGLMCFYLSTKLPILSFP